MYMGKRKRRNLLKYICTTFFLNFLDFNFKNEKKKTGVRVNENLKILSFFTKFGRFFEFLE